MTSIHEKLYGVPAASSAEVKAVSAEVDATFESLSVGVVDLEPVSFELFSEGMKALTAAGFSNFREMDSNAFNVWFETLKHLGPSLFSMTVNQVIHTGKDRFRTGRVLLGDIIQMADECYNDILMTLKEEADTTVAYYKATKRLGLPRLTPAQLIHRKMIQQALPALTQEDRQSLPAISEEMGMSDYDAQSHGVGEVF